MLRAKGNYKRNQNQKLLQGIIWEETKNVTNSQSIKKQVNSGCMMNSSGWRHEQCSQDANFTTSIFFVFFALLSSWSLICNVEFD